MKHVFGRAGKQTEEGSMDEVILCGVRHNFSLKKFKNSLLVSGVTSTEGEASVAQFTMLKSTLGFKLFESIRLEYWSV